MALQHTYIDSNWSICLCFRAGSRDLHNRLEKNRFDVMFWFLPYNLIIHEIRHMVWQQSAHMFAHVHVLRVDFIIFCLIWDAMVSTDVMQITYTYRRMLCQHFKLTFYNYQFLAQLLPRNNDNHNKIPGFLQRIPKRNFSRQGLTSIMLNRWRCTHHRCHMRSISKD